MREIDKFISFIKKKDGIGNKARLIEEVCSNFGLTKDRKVYYCNSFAVRFSYSSSGGFSNTVLSLSQLQKFDKIPFLVCLVTKIENRVFLANSTFLKKISHSSQELSLYNIKGSFNGSDIVKEFNRIKNNRDNIYKLFAIHSEIGFEGNFARLVEATKDISPTGKKYEIGKKEKENIFNSVKRAIEFIDSKYFNVLKEDLDNRVNKYHSEILVASHIENVNLRGRIIEFLISGENESIKKKIVSDIKEEYNKLPQFKTNNTLGDYRRIFENDITETDVKTKVMMLNSNPKAYNVDKFLEFHGQNNTVFLFYFIGIDAEKIVNKILLSVFQKDLLESTIVLKHWAGRNSRGVTQFEGATIHSLILSPNKEVDEKKAKEFLISLIDL